MNSCPGEKHTAYVVATYDIEEILDTQNGTKGTAL
jgi:hypothetical protein